MRKQGWSAGCKLVCIKRGAWHEFSKGEQDASIFPLHGAIYTADYFIEENDEVFVHLEEIQVGYFAACHFRPVQPRDTSIAVFTGLLNTAPAGVREEA